MQDIAFKKLNKVRLSDQIIDTITGMIETGQLKPGDQLPPERQLAEMLSVSRLPLREALKALEATNVIESHASEGYLVKGLEVASLVEAFNSDVTEDEDLYNEMREARMFIETAAAELACERRTEKDIRLMQEAVNTMRSSIEGGDVKLILETSMDFHERMMEAAHNTMFNRMLLCLYSSMLQTRRLLYEKKPDRYNTSPDEHQAILDAIKARDVKTTRKLLMEHLRTAL